MKFLCAFNIKLQTQKFFLAGMMSKSDFEWYIHGLFFLAFAVILIHFLLHTERIIKL